MNYIVVEFQTTEQLGSDNTSVLTDVFASKDLAEQKYHTVLAAAAVSGLKYHGALLMDAFGNVMKMDHYPEYQELDID